MARKTITLKDITDLDLNLARNERAITAATDISGLSAEERQQRLQELQQKIQQGTASLFEEHVLTLLLEPRGAERILAIQRHLPRIENALKKRSGSQRITETPSSDTPSPAKTRSKAAASAQQYPSELLDFLASQKPPTPPATNVSVNTPRSTRIEPESPTPSGWSRRDQIIVALLGMLLLAAIFYGIMTGRKPEAPILTFDQQAHQQESTTELASLPPATQAEFDAAMQTLRAGNFEQGKTRILAFIAQHPQSSQAELGYLALADTYRQRQNDPDEALVYYQKLLEEYPQSASKGLVHLKMGFAYEDMEDRSNAEAMYRLVLQEHGSQSRLGQLATQRLHAFSDEP